MDFVFSTINKEKTTHLSGNTTKHFWADTQACTNVDLARSFYMESKKTQYYMYMFSKSTSGFIHVDFLTKWKTIKKYSRQVSFV